MTMSTSQVIKFWGKTMRNGAGDRKWGKEMGTGDGDRELPKKMF